MTSEYYHTSIDTTRSSSPLTIDPLVLALLVTKHILLQWLHVVDVLTSTSDHTLRPVTDEVVQEEEGLAVVAVGGRD